MKLTLFVLLFLAAISAFAEPIILATSPWPPYAGESLDNFGFTREIVCKAFKVSGINIECVIGPAVDVYNQVDSGEITGLFNMTQTSQRRDKYLFSQPYYMSVSYLICLNGNEADCNSIKELDTKIVGVLKGYATSEPFYNCRNIIEFENDKQALKALFAYQIDMVPMDRLVAEYIVRNDPDISGDINTLVFSCKPIRKATIHLMLPIANDESEEIISLFNTGLSQIRENGKYKEILTKYGYQEYAQ